MSVTRREFLMTSAGAYMSMGLAQKQPLYKISLAERDKHGALLEGVAETFGLDAPPTPHDVADALAVDGGTRAEHEEEAEGEEGRCSREEDQAVVDEELEERGSIFQTTVDSEIILHLMAQRRVLDRHRDAVGRELEQLGLVVGEAAGGEAADVQDADHAALDEQRDAEQGADALLAQDRVEDVGVVDVVDRDQQRYDDGPIALDALERARARERLVLKQHKPP